ncbi:E3 ubiquitin/ISG15 ligase TRIM25-like [Tachysurus vachellii]|uniref:E3 ubiquitin/ISG15 ligase TRIM25-like n=1 Tax=Tachysurus vachellii TaxID=175792 RepID=UPI00296AC1DE|nr:E3 ubiquitin/ISG15 ligase TRIM25-like [Tachysurus vachellii]
MAEASISVGQDHFSCSVCLDLLNDPVTTPCGHNFCMVCINAHWDQEDVKGIYSCPQCRETFTPRPVLRRNNMLAEVVEKLKKTELQAASPAHCYAGPGDVECDFCTGRKHKAVKSCLVCQASYCDDHLKPHYQSPAFKKHKLVEACAELQEKICSEHDKLMEIYSRTDQSLICYLCTMEEHKGHDTVSAKAERTKKQLTCGHFITVDLCYLTLDPNTVHPVLILSENNRVVTRSETQQQYSDHPERFDSCPQVLCKESVCGRCYWEVERSGYVDISVSYKEISRKGQGDESLFGHNSQSWILWCCSSYVSFWHNSIETELRGPSSSRIGVYVDHSAGTLSFYSVSDTMRLLHRVHTTFTQPLYTGFRMGNNNSYVRFCDPK